MFWMNYKESDMDKSVTQIIEEVCQDICDNYCKHPTLHTPDEWENVMDEVCENCPLNRLQ